MAALPAVPKVVRLDHHHDLAGASNVQIREFYQYAGTLSVADAVTWLDAIVTAYNTFIHTWMLTTCSTTYAELTDLTSSSSAQVFNSTGATGTDANPALTAGASMVMRHHIVRRYRGGHPRVYLPGLSTARLAAATAWDPTSLANIVAAYITYLAAATTTPGGTAIGAITHVNVSYFEGFTNHTYPSGRVKAIPTPRVTPLVDTIVNVSGNPKPATQRRRDQQSP